MKNISILIFLLLIPFSSFALETGDTSKESPGIHLENPIASAVNDNTGKPNINFFIGRIIQYALGVVGSVALVMFVYGGFVWMLSSGNSEQVQKGKNIFIWSTVGMIVIFSGYLLVRFILTSLQGTA